MSWKPVTRFDQLKTGDKVRFKARPEITGLYRFKAHEFALVIADKDLPNGRPRDVLCKLKELEVLR